MQRSLLTVLATYLLLSSCAQAQIPGCNDPLANNYNSSATVNDGSCTYAPATVTPVSLAVLGDTVSETSGLLWWNDKLWTHVDNTDTHIYALDSTTGNIIASKNLTGASNYDWEEITQDNDYIYIGNFGNNGSGNRQDMHILRIAKAAANDSIVVADTISFSYEDQVNFTATSSNNTNFDCEAFLATTDSLYLFTKQWINKKTKLYALPKVPGNYTAALKDSLDVQGLITSAHYQADRKTIVLSGYNVTSMQINPFAYLLYGFTANQFFSGNKRKVGISAPLHQVEAITSANGSTFFITNEMIANSLVTITPKLQRINLDPYLSGYYQSLPVRQPVLSQESVSASPNPAANDVQVKVTAAKTVNTIFQITDITGKLVLTQVARLNAGMNAISLHLPDVSKGIYTLNIVSEGMTITKKLVCGQD